MPNQPATPARSVRVGDWLWEQAKKKAAAEGTTVSAVINWHLGQYVTGPDPWQDPTPF